MPRQNLKDVIEAFITYKKEFGLPDEISGSAEDISLDSFSFFLDFLTASRENACLLWGNEPLLHPELDKLLWISRKKRIFVVLETAGSHRLRLRQLLNEYAPVLRWKIYHTTVYPEDKWGKLVDEISNVASNHKIPIEFSLIIHNLFLDYAFFLPLLKMNSVTGFHLEILPQALRVQKNPDIENLRQAFTPLLYLIKQASQTGLKVTVGCVSPPCIFSDKDFGFLAKVGALPNRCLPYPGVLPDLRVYHCRALAKEAERRLASFKDFPAVKEYFFLDYGEFQRKSYLFPVCKECISYKVKVCFGGCLVLKKEKGFSG